MADDLMDCKILKIDFFPQTIFFNFLGIFLMWLRNKPFDGHDEFV